MDPGFQRGVLINRFLIHVYILPHINITSHIPYCDLLLTHKKGSGFVRGNKQEGGDPVIVYFHENVSRISKRSPYKQVLNTCLHPAPYYDHKSYCYCDLLLPNHNSNTESICDLKVFIHL